MNIIEYQASYQNQVLMTVALAQIGAGYAQPCLTADLYDIPKYYNEKNGKFWIALDDNDTILATLGFIPGDDPAEAVLARFFVKYDCKRQGIGKQMLAFAENYIFSKGFQLIRAPLSKRYAPYHAFYIKQGYVYERPLSVIKKRPNNYSVDLSI